MGMFWSMRPQPGSMDSIQTVDVTSNLPFDLQIFGPYAEQLTSSSATSNEINWNKEVQLPQIRKFGESLRNSSHETRT